MIKNCPDDELRPVFANLRSYNYVVQFTRDISRFYSQENFSLPRDAQTIYQNLKKYTVGEFGDLVFRTMMASKMFRFNFEDKNKEQLFFSRGARSSYYRWVEMVQRFLTPTLVQTVLIIAPDKHQNDVSISGLIDAMVKKNMATVKINVILVSNLPQVGSLLPQQKGHVRVSYNIKTTTDFYNHMEQYLKTSDLIVVDFTEIHQVGSMLYGSHGRLNGLLNQITTVHIDVIRDKTFFIRTSFSGRVNYLCKAENLNVQLFKAGGMTFQISCTFSKDADMDTNFDMLRKIASIKMMTDDDRKKILLRGYGLKYIDSKNPVEDPLGFDLDVPMFNLVNKIISPIGYCHSRATNKFTRGKDDLLQFYIDQRVNKGDVGNGLIKKIANALIRNNFDAEHALSDVRKDLPLEKITSSEVKRAMQAVIGVQNQDPSLLKAIRQTIVYPKTKEKLRKICADIDKHLNLFVEIKEGETSLYSFVGFIPDDYNNQDNLVSFFEQLVPTFRNYQNDERLPVYDDPFQTEKVIRPYNDSDDDQVQSKRSCKSPTPPKTPEYHPSY